VTQLRLYGYPIDIIDVATGHTGVSPTAPAALAPIPVRRYVRNGKAVDVGLANRLRDHANFAALYRSKEVFHGASTAFANGPSTGWRFAFHTGPYTHALLSRVLLAVPFNNNQASVTLSIYSNAAMTTLVDSHVYYYGAGSILSAYGWKLTREVTGWLNNVSPDTDYYGQVTSTDGGTVTGMTVFDMQSLSENFAGYLSTNLTMHNPVLSSDRADVSTIAKALWKRGGAQVFNWYYDGNGSLNQDSSGGGVACTTTLTTDVNVIDRVSTAPSASSAGVTVDMRMKDRVSQSSGVPCVMKVWGHVSSAGQDMVVTLKNAAGATIATVNGFSTTDGWKSVAFNMPAVVDKYDVFFHITPGGGGTRAFCGAVSIYEYE
jgi:hypothetical protein